MYVYNVSRSERYSVLAERNALFLHMVNMIFESLYMYYDTANIGSS